MHVGPRRSLLFLALAATSGCGSGSRATGPLDGGGGEVTDASFADAPSNDAGSGLGFPSAFVFGTAIAGFQADMGCPSLDRATCDDPNSDWYAFTTSPRTIADPTTYLSGQDPSVVGPGFWELYPDDVRRADETLHGGALRLSIEWSRVFPTATDGVDGYDALKAMANAAALARYHAMFAELKRRKMRPFVTLNHYTLPTWIHDAVGCHADFANCTPRGWVDADRTVREAAKYAAFCAQEFGAEVDLWATLNEPLQNVIFGYVQPSAARSHPPAVFLQTDAAKTALHALIDAHARMYDAVKTNDTVDADGDGVASSVGVVYPLVPVEPNDPSAPLDVQAAENVDYLWNRAYLEAVVLGQYDENLDGTTVERADLKGRMDYVGVNWYSGLRVTGIGVSVLPGLSPKLTANPLGFVETPNQPEKLASFVRFVNVDLGMPVIISENGTTDPDDDGSAPRFIVRNLKAVAEAALAGADVRGYFYWTLMDNYEWNHGMDLRMGLFAVDKNDPAKQRTPRKGADVFGQIAGSRVLSDALIREYAQGD
jgi:beta-glucosidase/6-phospho-beta-glucosidase/beta-galactosidase